MVMIEPNTRATCVSSPQKEASGKDGLMGEMVKVDMGKSEARWKSQFDVFDVEPCIRANLTQPITAIIP